VHEAPCLEVVQDLRAHDTHRGTFRDAIRAGSGR
jgi:hypothetical protein